jgi:hypothetical protein
MVAGRAAGRAASFNGKESWTGWSHVLVHFVQQSSTRSHVSPYGSPYPSWGCHFLRGCSYRRCESFRSVSSDDRVCDLLPPILVYCDIVSTFYLITFISAPISEKLPIIQNTVRIRTAHKKITVHRSDFLVPSRLLACVRIRTMS